MLNFDDFTTHLYKLNNMNKVISYLSTNRTIMKENNPRQLKKRVLIEHNKTFMTLFKSKVINDFTTLETLG